jgi:hypothetical protein
MSLLHADTRTGGHDEAKCRIFALIIRIQFLVSPSPVRFLQDTKIFPSHCGLLLEAINATCLNRTSL